ncbi:GDSL esterase/lipase [Dendrobium catenatum]|uniref:GDSL esterase/lipase n=1 Tax=Dendrobium catenatum TaxID=906689 RepID=A0A2I0WWG5_9ASPA|nr:GDSL esterase/lipase [Dendrobium catenatum]
MAFSQKQLLLLLRSTLCALLLLLLAFPGPVRPAPQVPCYFIFGDSLVDNGNNNDIASLARANYLPYGIDFPGGPSGRFSNGLTTVDGGRITFSGQMQNYVQAAQEIVEILGDEDTAANYLSKCLFQVGMGSNDYLNNYFMPAVYSSSRQYTPDQFADVLIQQYSEQIRVSLYNYGARKVAIIGVGQVGCSPSELAQLSSDGVTCIDRIDSAIQLFNKRLIQLVNEFNRLDGAHFTFINAFNIFQDIITNPSANGLRVTNRGCCGVGRNNGQITCLPYQTPCPNRREYLFWDAFHPTEAGNILIGRRSYSAQSSSDASPMDIRHLAQI